MNTQKQIWRIASQLLGLALLLTLFAGRPSSQAVAFAAPTEGNGFNTALIAPDYAASAAVSIYWGDEGGALRYGPVGGSIVGPANDLFSSATPCGVAIDRAAGKVYWASWGNDAIQSGNLDGSGSITNLFSETDPCGVAIDTVAGKIYWASYPSDAIRVGNLNGSGSATTLFDSTDGVGDGPSGVAIHAGKIYWTTQDGNQIQVGNRDGTGTAENLFSGEDNPIGVAINPANNKIYWANCGSGICSGAAPGTIRVGNLDGTGTAETLFDGSVAADNVGVGPVGVAIDPTAGKIYWGTFGSGQIQVGNLDGSSNATTLFSGETNANFPALLFEDSESDDSVTIELLDHNGVGIAGGQVQYYSGGWHTVGTTDGSGQVTVDLPTGSYSFSVNYAFARQEMSQNIGDNATVVFQTKLVTVELRNSAYALLDTGHAQYYSGGWHDIGDTSGGQVSIELLPLNYSFSMNYAFARQEKSQNVASSNTVTFQTTLVTVELRNSANSLLDLGHAQYYSNGWHDIGDTSSGQVSIELLPLSYSFSMNYAFARQEKSQNVANSTTVTFQTTNVAVSLKTCASVGLSGGKAQYYSGGWHDIGLTDGNGRVSIELLPLNYSFSMDYAFGRNEKSQNVASDSNVVFNTTKVALNFSGAIQYYAGGWHGFTKPSMELLPGNYPFAFDSYQTTIPVSGCTVEFSPTVIKLLNSTGGGLPNGTADYYDGGWKPIGVTPANGTLIFMLPGTKGTLTFRMSYVGASIQKSQNINTNSVVVFQTALVTVKLLDSNNNALAGGAQYYASGWHTFGSGTAQTTMELLPLNYTFMVSYGGASQQKSQDVGANPVVEFNTIQVTMKLLNSGGGALAGGAQYYASGWHAFGGGTTETTMELLPLNYTFMVSYGGASLQKSQNVSANPVVEFDTVKVTMKLLDLGGGALAGGAQYYASGWHTFGSGTTEATMELLPVNYTFMVSYGGASLQKSQNVASDRTVVFRTVQVTMKLLDSGGGALAGGAQYYASGWKTFGSGTTEATMELLPVNYTFMVSYGGASLQKSQDVSTNPVVEFGTVKVTMKLLDLGGGALAGGAQYYASGWHTFGSGTTEATMELLPLNYTFMVSYGGASLQKSQNVASDRTVVFQTVQVTMKLLDSMGGELAGAGQYYASGWKTFGITPASLELLPTNYTFMVSYGGATIQKSQNVAIDPVVIFTGTKVTLQFTGDIQYYAGGWKTFTKPSTNLLPGTYTFLFSGAGYPAIQTNITVGGSEMINSIAYARLINHSGVGLAGGVADYYDGSWKNAGTTNSSGAALGILPGLKSSVTFNMSFNGAGIQKSQNIAANSFVVFQTVNVSFRLLDSTNTDIAGSTQYYGNGWKTFGSGTTATSMELLPTTYSFSVSYAGASIQKPQNVAIDPNVVFQTVNVSFRLLDSTNTDIAGSTQYYGNGWKTFGSGTTATSMELLPTTYSFSVSYAGASIQKSQDVSKIASIVFQTSKVHSTSGACTLYYANGWKTFSQDMELLPTSYSFQFNDGTPQTNYTITAGTVNNIH